MSPDSLEATKQRRAWRFISALGCLLGATAILLAAVLAHNAEEAAKRGQKAICAIIVYSEDTLDQVKNAPPQRTSPGAVKRFRVLVHNMRATGVECPPNPHKEVF